MTPPGATTTRAGEPTVAATVITIRTTLQPQNKTFTHTIAIANGHARSDREVDRWRLFDLDHNTITYVDDLAKTYYTVPVDGAPASAGPDRPKTGLQATGQKRVVQGVEATQFLMRMGGYQRELWIGAPPDVPPQLWGMLDDTFAAVRGFPLIDHAELPYGKSKLVVDHTVVSIDRRNVPQSLLNVSADYRNVTAPDVNRQSASSPRSGQSTREEELRLYEKVQKAP